MPTAPASKRAETVPDWKAVVAHLPALEARGFTAGKWVASPGELPYFELSPAAAGLQKALYESGVVYDFDWGAWGHRAERLLASRAALDRSSLRTLRKLLVTHVRKDRFCEGHLVAMLESGHMAHVLRRIAEILGRPAR